MAKRSASSLKSSKGKVPKSKRFNFDVEDDDFEELKKGFIPPNTSMDTQKCVRLFEEWAKQRSDLFPNEPVPSKIL